MILSTHTSLHHRPRHPITYENFRSSESHHACMFGRVVTKVNDVKCQEL